MDDFTEFNRHQWNELVSRGVLYARPLLDLTAETAREWLDPNQILGDVTGKTVLCLASGGGKQSAAFGVLGADVHVLDFSSAMLERDQQTAAHYGYPVDLQLGDMRDLSRFAGQSFDIVWQPYSINYIPDPTPVFQEVARVIKPGGLYHLQIHNPFFIGMIETDWTEAGYPIKLLYTNGEAIPAMPWDFEDGQGQMVSMEGPREFRHTLSGVVNPLAGLGFIPLGLFEYQEWNTATPPGTWEHLARVAPPWLTLYFAYRPEVMNSLPRPR